MFLLFINGVAALFGGWSLMIDPSGVDLGLPSEWMSMLPFQDYFIPGVLLFMLNGISSIVAAIATMGRSRGFEKFIILQGALVTLWILAQVIIFRTVADLHFALAGIGLTLLALGVILVINRIYNGVSNHG